MQRRRGLQSVPFSAFARNSSVFQLGQGKFRIGNQGARIWSTVAKREIQVADPRGRADESGQNQLQRHRAVWLPRREP